MKEYIPYAINSSPEIALMLPGLEINCLNVLMFYIDVILMWVQLLVKIISTMYQLLLSFNFRGFRDMTDLQPGKISWKIFYNIFEKDGTLDANLKIAPKVTIKVNFAKLFFCYSWVCKIFLCFKDLVFVQKLYTIAGKILFSRS